MTNDIVSPPPKWSATLIAGPNTKGRDRHFVDGNARVGDQKVSVHAAVRIAKGVQSAHTPSSHVQALVSCKGTINIETDSVRKYTEDKYKHSKSKAAGKRKHGKEDKGAVHSNKKSKSKSKHKKTSRKSSLARVESDGEPMNDSHGGAGGKLKEVKVDADNVVTDPRVQEAVQKYMPILEAQRMSKTGQINLLRHMLLLETNETVREVVERVVEEDGGTLTDLRQKLLDMQ